MTAQQQLNVSCAAQEKQRAYKALLLKDNKSHAVL